VLPTSKWKIQAGHSTAVTFLPSILFRIHAHYGFPMTFPLKATVEFHWRSTLPFCATPCCPLLKLS